MTRPFGALAALLILLSFLQPPPAAAWQEYPEWRAGNPAVSVSDRTATPSEVPVPDSCVTEIITVRAYRPAEACVTRMKGWRYALFPHTYQQYGLTFTEQLFVVAGDNDAAMRVVIGMPETVRPLDNPGSSTLVYHAKGSGILAYRDFFARLVRSGDGFEVPVSITDEIRYADGGRVVAGTVGVARGGGWLAAQTPDGIARINLATGDARMISSATTNDEPAGSGASELAVSDDGRVVFMGGRLTRRQFRVITVTDSCGARLPADITDARSCPERDLTTLLGTGALPDGRPIGLRSTTHGRRLDFYVDTGAVIRPVALFPAGGMPAPLHYLALGDSFSSGEGDTGRDAAGRSYYLPFTDDPAVAGAPRETCHLSRRSYPFVLGSLLRLDAVRGEDAAVRSVACNNARIADIYKDDPNGYPGQDGRLAGQPAARLSELRAAAMDGFVPGRVRQSAFVEAYQPRTLTVGIGGNDVQFARVLAACATSVLTCSYASDPADRRNVGDSIAALYPKLTATYAALARTDPGAKVYAVGYPRFVNTAATACPASTGLDPAERRLVDEGVVYLNAVIRAAALTAGVGYLDIAGALDGHRLCDPDSYVNAIDFTNVRRQETFHPTPEGHAAEARMIARGLDGSDPATYAYCAGGRATCPVPTAPPGLPAFFGDGSVRPVTVALPSELITPTTFGLPVLTKGAEFVVQLGLLAAGSTTRIELHSDTETLASPSVGTDGTLTAALTLPDSVAAGYHTVHVYATSASGDPVDAYEIVYVGDAGTAAPAGQGTAGAGSSGGSLITTGAEPSAPVPAACSGACQPGRLIAELPATFGRRPLLWFAAALAAAAVPVLVTARTLWRRRSR